MITANRRASMFAPGIDQPLPWHNESDFTHEGMVVPYEIEIESPEPESTPELVVTGTETNHAEPATFTFDVSTFAGRAALVATAGGNLEEHLCCPQCFDQRAIKTGDLAQCDLCGWTGEVVNLLDTVQTGTTQV